MSAGPVVAVGVLTLALGGCGVGREDVADQAGLPHAGITLAEARAFGEYPLFYAGDSVGGHSLVAIVRREDTARYVSFVYGDCEPVPPEGGCAPPIEVQVWPAGARSLRSYDPAARGSPAIERGTLRGRPAAYVGDGRIELDLDRSTVVVFSASRERGLAVVAALRCVTATTSTPVGTLSC